MDDFRQLGPKDAAPSVYKRASALSPLYIESLAHHSHVPF